MAKEFDDRDRDGNVEFAPSGGGGDRAGRARLQPGKINPLESPLAAVDDHSLSALALRQGQQIFRAAGRGRLELDDVAEHAYRRLLEQWLRWTTKNESR